MSCPLFWGAQIAAYLNERAAARASPVIVNLASQEYFKSVGRKALKAPVVTCVFEEWHGERYTIISVMAKREEIGAGGLDHDAVCSLAARRVDGFVDRVASVASPKT